MKQVLWYLIAGTRGGETRARLIQAIRSKPANANQLAISLKLDYKTIQHHLEILVENNVFTAINKGKYGAVYFLSKELEQNWMDFEGIWKQFGKK